MVGLAFGDVQRGIITQVGGCRKMLHDPIFSRPSTGSTILMTNAEIQFGLQFNFWPVQVKIKFE